MSDVAIVYWSGKGNTEAMARLIAQGAANDGASVTIYEAHDFNAEKLDRYQVVALGCPAMHVEELEKTTFAPMMDSLDPHLAGHKIVLFGSFGWGTGEWMEKWEQRVVRNGADLLGVLKVNGAPTGAQGERCVSMGQRMAVAAEGVAGQAVGA